MINKRYSLENITCPNILPPKSTTSRLEKNKYPVNPNQTQIVNYIFLTDLAYHKEIILVPNLSKSNIRRRMKIRFGESTFDYKSQDLFISPLNVGSDTIGFETIPRGKLVQWNYMQLNTCDYKLCVCNYYICVFMQLQAAMNHLGLCILFREQRKSCNYRYRIHSSYSITVNPFIYTYRIIATRYMFQLKLLEYIPVIFLLNFFLCIKWL